MRRPSIPRRLCLSGIRVTPTSLATDQSEHRSWIRSAATRAYTWATWGFLALLLFAQVFGIVFTSATTQQHQQFGRDPSEGRGTISGLNDDPFSDRLIVCQRQSRFVRPMQLSVALRSSKAVVENTSGAAVHGYRVCSRDKIALDRSTLQKYKLLCAALDATLDGIFSACDTLGYNVTRDYLRIVDGIDSATMTVLDPTVLPVLIMPYWDNAVYARFTIPSWDGSACPFTLPENYEQPDTQPKLFALARAVAERKTREFLDEADGEWRNGWFETPSGEKWYSYLSSTAPSSELFGRKFDTTTGRELDRFSTLADEVVVRTETWGATLRINEVSMWYNSIAISNGHRIGLFLYESSTTRTVFSAYTVAIFVSNSSLMTLLLRWLVAIVLYDRRSAAAKREAPVVLGLGTIASTRYFQLLPLLLVPRLKTTLAAFFSVGCQFEGEQKALAEAWFVMYPAIGELVLFYYSLINLLAKMLQRRVSDTLFGPTLLFYSLLHIFRFELAQSGWFEFDGRVTTVVGSAEFEQLRLIDFVTTDAAFRMNGTIVSLFTIKMVVLALNLTPFLWSTRLPNVSASVRSNRVRIGTRTNERRASKATNTADSSVSRVNSVDSVSDEAAAALLEIEQALVIRVARIGGLGRPLEFEFAHPNSDRRDSSGAGSSDGTKQLDSDNPDADADKAPRLHCEPTRLLSCYELARLGQYVLSDRYLVSAIDWFWLALVSRVRHCQPFANLRVSVHAVTVCEGGSCSVEHKLRYVTAGGPELADVNWRDISLRQIR